MLAIKACSLKPALKCGAFKLASISLDLDFLPVFCNRCFQNIVEELQAPQLRFLECSFLCYGILKQNTWKGQNTKKVTPKLCSELVWDG